MAIPQGPYYKALGANIRAHRKKRAMTQAKLATAVGLTRTSITNIEMGRQPVYIHVLAKLARNLGTTIEVLLPGKPAREIEFDSHLASYSKHQKEWIVGLISQENP